MESSGSVLSQCAKAWRVGAGVSSRHFHTSESAQRKVSPSFRSAWKEKKVKQEKEV